MDNGLPNEHKDVSDTFVAMQDFALHDDVLHLYSDNASEISKAAIALKWRNSTCTPNRPQSNGAAEQAVRRVLDGTRTILYRSGLPHSWWAEASKCYCCLRNITDVVKEGKTPYELRHSTPYPGLRIPFGAYVHYLPTGEKAMAQRDKFGPRSLPGMFVGYHFAPGGIFKENYLIVDMERFLQSNGVAVPVQRVGRVVLEPGCLAFPFVGFGIQQVNQPVPRQVG